MKTGIYKCLDGSSERYFKDGLFHREDGPAIIYPDGNQFWYFNGNLHREDGPAIVHRSGAKSWFINGKRHRFDGPAVEDVDGYKAWYLDDVNYSEQEYKAIIRKEKLNKILMKR